MGKFLASGAQQQIQLQIFSCKTWAWKPVTHSVTELLLCAWHCMYNREQSRPPLTVHARRRMACFLARSYSYTHVLAHVRTCPLSLSLWENNLATCIKSSNIKHSLWHRNLSLQEIYLKEVILNKKRKNYVCVKMFMLKNMTFIKQPKCVTGERINTVCEARWMDSNAEVEIVTRRSMVITKNAFSAKWKELTTNLCIWLITINYIKYMCL